MKFAAGAAALAHLTGLGLSDLEVGRVEFSAT
jgi:hypothetical protein